MLTTQWVTNEEWELAVHRNILREMIPQLMLLCLAMIKRWDINFSRVSIIGEYANWIFNEKKSTTKFGERVQIFQICNWSSFLCDRLSVQAHTINLRFVKRQFLPYQKNGHAQHSQNIIRTFSSNCANPWYI